MKHIIAALLQKLYLVLWLVVHFVYNWQNEIRNRLRFHWKHAKERLSSCIPSRTYCGELVKLTKSVDRFTKVPKHLAISLIVERGRGVDLQSLAKVVSWAWIANVPVITLYDYEGKLKQSYRELSTYLREELVQSFWASKKDVRGGDPPIVKFHNLPKINGYSNGVNHSNGFKSGEDILHIMLTSFEDGKPEIARVARECHFEESKANACKLQENGLQKEDVQQDVVDEAAFEKMLNAKSEWRKSIKAPADPDALLILGEIHSTLGFLPWHMRLTEIYWLPKLHLIETKDFYNALARFSRCQQRFGT